VEQKENIISGRKHKGGGRRQKNGNWEGCGAWSTAWWGLDTCASHVGSQIDRCEARQRSFVGSDLRL